LTQSLTTRTEQSESVLIQKLYTHFKKTPGTHKLGVLYVVDSVTRKWMEQAKAQGQPISRTAQDGTPAAGVHRVTELMPTLMNDITATAPEDQKVRRKQINIEVLSVMPGAEKRRERRRWSRVPRARRHY